jgi:hypothetical protein
VRRYAQNVEIAHHAPAPLDVLRRVSAQRRVGRPRAAMSTFCASHGSETAPINARRSPATRGSAAAGAERRAASYRQRVTIDGNVRRTPGERP